MRRLTMLQAANRVLLCVFLACLGVAGCAKSGREASYPAGEIPSPPPGMVLVEAGQFIMGRNDGPVDEQPARKVSIPAFYIDKYKVTNSGYAAFIEATGHPPPRDWPDGRIPIGREDFPVVNVSWQDAVAYAKWAKKRLPTEKEWEKAARGPAGRLYPWGNEPDVTMHATEAKLRPVGSIPSNVSPYGCYDMVSYPPEWTCTYYTIPLAPTSNERPPVIYELSYILAGMKLKSDYRRQTDILQSLGGGAELEDILVIKGGARSMRAPWSTTATYREGIDVRVPEKGIGFRCAKSISGTE
ncbi:MAG: formylglycine-generating enzyme family protein [Planctomycetes bacterium]|nr:formylglycine-generating enzyme family protein [Planctomycetota bacterium]